MDRPAELGKTGPGRHNCPICNKKMEEIALGQKHQVLIDRCHQGHGLWFDKGELKEIIDIMGGRANQKVAALLQDIFGEKKSQL
jgi:Zn-finger nucleic acid-binding protein